MFLKQLTFKKTGPSKECDICHCRYFLYEGHKFQSNICNGCHDLLMITIYFKDIAILNNGSVDLLQNVDLTQKRGTLKNMFFYHIQNG